MDSKATETGDSDSKTTVQLGFSVAFEDDEHRSLVAHKSPQWQEWDGGQIGGRPSWLQPKDIPLSGVKCDGCSEPLVFVCQIYAPTDEVTSEAFHRSLYLFACASKDCANRSEGSIKVLRTQLPEENPYYPPKPEEEVNWTRHTPNAWGVNICAVCGQRGKGFCSLQEKYFCGKQHQVEYKKFLPQNAVSSPFFPSVYTESELVVEEEPSAEVNKKSLESKGIFTNDGNDEDADLEQDDLNAITGAITSEASKDPTTIEFYARTKGLPNVQDQCLRYMRWPLQESATNANMPLWMRSDHQVSKDIPPCNYCGAARKFEFQIMPQMIHYLMQDHEKQQSVEKGGKNAEQIKEAIAQASSILEQAPAEQVPPELANSKEKAVEAMRSKLMDDNDGLNWGVVCVYTCTASCGSGLSVEEGQELGAYREEYAWKQPSLD